MSSRTVTCSCMLVIALILALPDLGLAQDYEKSSVSWDFSAYGSPTWAKVKSFTLRVDNDTEDIELEGERVFRIPKGDSLTLTFTLVYRFIGTDSEDHWRKTVKKFELHPGEKLRVGD